MAQALVIGTDIPNISTEILEQGLAAREQYEVCHKGCTMLYPSITHSASFKIRKQMHLHS